MDIQKKMNNQKPMTVAQQLMLADKYWKRGMPLVNKAIAVLAAGQIMRIVGEAGQDMLGINALSMMSFAGETRGQRQFFVDTDPNGMHNIKFLNNLLLLKEDIEKSQRT